MKPILDLTSAVDQISLGKDVEIPIVGNDEISLLGYSFKQMLETVSDSKKTVQDANFKLISALKKEKIATRAKSKFLANMSHEIRTPLNGILGITELVLGSDLKQKQKEDLEIVLASSQTLMTILNDILDFSKIEAGEFQLTNSEFSLSDLIHHIQKLYLKEVKDKQIKLICMNVVNSEDSLIGDVDRLRQILMNLVNNAIKFTPSNGEISLKVSSSFEDDDFIKVHFSIQDNGIGIKEENQKKLFKEFSQVDSSNSRKYGGTGLGLSIVKNLISLMGGEIGLISKENVGSTFYFDLRLRKTQKRQIENLDSHKVSINYSEKRVLVVEDVLVNQMVVCGMLKKIGFLDIDIANDGFESLEMFKNNCYDIIFMDIQMPKMDGYEAAKKIREMKKDFSQPPIIALTADAFESVEKNSLKNGMNDFLTKPINGEKLLNIVNKWIHTKIT